MRRWCPSSRPSGRRISWLRPRSAVWSRQAFTGLDEAHPHQEVQSDLLILLISILISPKNTVTETPRIMFEPVSKKPVAQSSWHTEWTTTPPQAEAKGLLLLAKMIPFYLGVLDPQLYQNLLTSSHFSFRNLFLQSKPKFKTGGWEFHLHCKRATSGGHSDFSFQKPYGYGCTEYGGTTAEQCFFEGRYRRFQLILFTAHFLLGSQK